MPRNAQGQYFLPDGNPVTPGELIKAEWANSTMDDVANALTNSLDRAGAGGMTGPLKAASGTLARPGITFVEDVTSGLLKESNGVVAAISQGKKQAYWSPNGLFVVSPPSDKLEVANKGYVDALASQMTDIVGTFGYTKTPADLPSNGYIPANWDNTGVPVYGIQLKEGQALSYRPADTKNPLFGNVFVYVGTNFVASGWANVGSVQGPMGPQGETGPQGPVGQEGPTGPQGPTGQTGATGPQGPQGIQGPIGPQGIQGSPGESAVIIGSFGASKTPADLPVSGLIPANWDAPGNPPANYQMRAGEALIYTDCPKGTANYGHVYEFVPATVSLYDLNNWVDLGDIVGPQGPQGIQGPQGNTGPQGIQGKDGAQGPEGPQGIQGPKGDVGPQGPKGDTGPQGPAGSDATVTSSSIQNALGYIPPSPTGGGASGTWGISISGNAAHASSADSAGSAGSANSAGSAGQISGGGWQVVPSGSNLLFVYNGTNMGVLDESGNLTVRGNLTAYGSV